MTVMHAYMHCLWMYPCIALLIYSNLFCGVNSFYQIPNVFRLLMFILCPHNFCNVLLTCHYFTLIDNLSLFGLLILSSTHTLLAQDWWLVILWYLKLMIWIDDKLFVNVYLKDWWWCGFMLFVHEFLFLCSFSLSLRCHDLLI